MQYELPLQQSGILCLLEENIGSDFQSAQCSLGVT